MSSPAQRYAAARQRQRHPGLTEFAGSYPFELDPFQREACEALEQGNGVLVCAPTGAGKTVVGEFAAFLALAQGGKCFYTTPIKALSNQKYNDLVERHGSENVGLLTGDTAINSEAPVVVMTTEVVRNMLYADSGTLAGLRYVVMDEVHYLGDRFRGGVWEEVIIHLPDDVTLVSLSATVSNAEEFGEWLVSVRGTTKVIVHEERPVPLYQHMMVGNRLLDLFDSAGPDVNGELRRAVDQRLNRYGPPVRGSRRTGPSRGFRPPDRAQVVARLDSEGLLPAITFVFSRAGCDAAVAQCVQAGLSLTTPAEQAEISTVAEDLTRSVPPEDLEVLGYHEWLDGLRRGFAAHHAGLIPAFKQTVESLFVQGLVRAVFATETLALGINMPARTVVLERLVKFNGEAHVDVTPGEYTQLTGRAGRRGIDIEGHAVVVWHPESDPARVAGLASTRTYPLRSTFRPSYNMAVNLVDVLGRPHARELLERSFAQFQTDRSVAGLLAQIRKNDITMEQYQKGARCDRGSVQHYLELRSELAEREKSLAGAGSRAQRGDATAALEKLGPGDVIRVPAGKRAGVAVVIDPGLPRGDALADPRPLVLTEDRWAGRLSGADFPVAVDVLGRLRVPRHFDHRSPQARRDLASALRELRIPPAPGRRAAPRRSRNEAAEAEIASLRRALRADLVHECPDRDDHVSWAQRAHRLADETAGLRHRIDGRTGTLGRRFDRLCELLEARGYLHGDESTPAGKRLARIWSESDLLTAECLRDGVWSGLDAAELAAAVSTLVYEPRRDEAVLDQVPSRRLREALAATALVWSDLAEAEVAAGLPAGRGPETGFVWPAWRWARGESLEAVLSDPQARRGAAELPPGDFVRWMKQVLDLLDQVASSDRDGERTPVARTAARASAVMRRGVVLQSMSG